MSFSSEIKEEILSKFKVSKKSMCCVDAERFGEYITLTQNKYQVKKDFSTYFDISKLNECCIKSIIKGAFLSSGCIINPATNYHFEIAFRNKSCSEYMVDLLSLLEFTPKLIKRKNTNQYIVYIKEAEQISLLLSMMEVSTSLFKFENIRVEKELKNNINRNINCETANLSKTITASMKQIDAINKIKKSGKYSSLDEKLKDVAKLREKYPNESIEFLSKKLSKKYKISKSGVKHRLDKLINIASESDK